MLFLIYLVADVITGIFAVCFMYRVLRKKKLTKLHTMTTGVITKIKKINLGLKAAKDEDLYKMWLEYTVDGGTFTATAEYSSKEGEYSEGQTIDVIYNENKPSRAIPDIYGRMAEWDKMKMALAVIPFFLLIVITVLTAPDTLMMTEEKENTYKIVTNSIVSVGALAFTLYYKYSGCYKKDFENDPKVAKGTVATAIIICCKCAYDVVMRLIIY